jgi:small multidrug resistance pump
LLAAAIGLEVGATLSLKMASAGRVGFYGIVVAGYVGAFGLFAFALRGGLPLGVAYGIWTASGVAMTAVAARFLFREPLNKVMAGGVGLIAVGVLLVEVGARH